MEAALAAAEAGLAAGELPIGAAVCVGDEVVATAWTQERAERRLLVHAELLALDAADRVLRHRRSKAVLFTTLEPCLMCLAAAATVGVARVVHALASPTDGSAEVAAWWDARRQPGLDHVRLPVVEHDRASEAASRALFARYDGPLVDWARTLL